MPAYRARPDHLTAHGLNAIGSALVSRIRPIFGGYFGDPGTRGRSAHVGKS